MAGAADLGATPAVSAGSSAERMALAKSAYEKAIARIGNKRSQTLQQYGYRSTGFDDLGNPTGVQVDQYNQYGEFQKMLHDDALLSMQATDDSVGRGLGGGPGLGNQSQSEVAYQHGERSYDMGRLLQNEWTGMNEDRLQADQDYAQSQWDAKHQAALEAIAQQSFMPASMPDYQPYDPGAYPPYTAPPSTGGAQHPVLPVTHTNVPGTRAQSAAQKLLTAAAKSFGKSTIKKFKGL